MNTDCLKTYLEIIKYFFTRVEKTPYLAPVPWVPVEITPATVSSDTVPNLKYDMLPLTSIS